MPNNLRKPTRYGRRCKLLHILRLVLPLSGRRDGCNGTKVQTEIAVSVSFLIVLSLLFVYSFRS